MTRPEDACHSTLTMPSTTPRSSASAFIAMMDSKTAGENGALEHSDAGSPLVALFFKLVRSLPDDSLASLTAAVPAEPAELADLTVLAFQTRATRGMGKGEKDLKYKRK